MYKISEFSQITRLTVKALRYYDEQGMLIPSHRGENNYRFYTEKDFVKADIIVMLREFDFSIAEIKDVLENYNSEEDVYVYLREKQTMLSKQISEQKKMIKKINGKIKTCNVEEIKMDYQFEIKEIGATPVIAIRENISWNNNAGDIISKLYSTAKAKTNGAMISLYYDDEYKEVSDTEICVPVSSKIEKNGIVYKTLPAQKMLCTTHIGRYEDLKNAYKAIFDYARSNNIKTSPPHRAVYIKGPGMIMSGNPDKYVTEIMLPIVE